MTEKADRDVNPYLGRMNDPTAGAWVTGPCGDTMEMYLVIVDNVLETVRYHTDGCLYTHVCGAAVAELAQGRAVEEALDICPAMLLRKFAEKLPAEHRHCVILAVSTLYRAIGEYWVHYAAC